MATFLTAGLYHNSGQPYSTASATVLGRVKRWVLAVLAMLARPSTVIGSPPLSAWRAARGSVRLRSRRVKDATLLTRPVRHSRRKASGREASRHIDTRLPRGVEQEATSARIRI